MKIAYFDCFAGASGDMILGALVDAGVSIEELNGEIGKLGLQSISIRAEMVTKSGIGGTKIAVVGGDSDHHHVHRHLHDIEAIIQGSQLDTATRRICVEIFRRLAEAEARVHRIPVDQVHFHEVGAVDTIVDVVGSVVGLQLLGVERVHCSPLNMGGGTVRCAHGELPVPAPATAELVRGKPVYSSGVNAELLTPTGAVILSTLATRFGVLPPMNVDRIGYGAGGHEMPFPNLLRLFVGECDPSVSGLESDSVVILEANVDDMNPQIFDFVMGELFAAGALDVYLTPVQMKKNRSAVLISVICPNAIQQECARILLRETTTIGVRWALSHRLKAQRSIIEVQTPYGTVRCKIAHDASGVLNVAPEYEDCKRLAHASHVPLKIVIEEAGRLARAEDSLQVALGSVTSLWPAYQ
jgi:pyridinium-3,5-bisthiocarboxylic acid mononucleotide nickel chelatase